MKEVYNVVRGLDDTYYTIIKTFETMGDAKKYLRSIRFYTPDNVWIAKSECYLKGEKFELENKGTPLIIAYLDENGDVSKVSVSEYPESGEKRTNTSFRFYLEVEEDEDFQDYLRRAKNIAIKKQNKFKQ